MKTNTLFGFILIFLIVGGYFLANSIHYANLESGAIGYGKCGREASFLPQFFIQTLYLVLAGAGIAFIAFFSEIKRFKLFALIIFSLFFLVGYTGIVGYNAHGRYIDCLVPLMLIGAFAYRGENKKLLLFGFSLALVSTWLFPMFWRDTINCFSNIYLLTPHIQYLFVGFIFLIFLFLMFAKDKKKVVSVIFAILLITFVTSNIVNFHYLNQASDNAFEDSKIGKYISENKIDGVIFDEDDFRNWWASYKVLNYYNKKFIPIGNESEKYFISSKILPYEILVEQERFSELEENSSGMLYLYYVPRIRNED